MSFSISHARCGEKFVVWWRGEVPAVGAAPRQGEDIGEWLASALADAGVRRFRHPGNYRYLFRIGRDRRERSRVVIAVTAASYPKKDPEQLALVKQGH